MTKFNTSGDKQWTRTLGGYYYDSHEGIAVSESGDVFVVGTTYSSLNENVSNGDSDAYLAKYDVDGTLHWIRQFGTEFEDEANAIALDSNGNPLVAGYSEGVLYSDESAGGKDVFLTRFVATLPGDTDFDGDIDDSDLGTAIANYTGPVGFAGGKTLADGDTDGDGDVDDSDLGTAFAGYTGPVSPPSVPEPGSLAVILGGLGLLLRRRRG